MDDRFLCVHPDDIEWDLGIFHPECPGLGVAEDKEHAAVIREMLSKHQTLGTFQCRIG
jgi:hypothetical protein